MAKKMQNKKLNKEDHKKISDDVKNAKIGIGVSGTALAGAVVFIKKYGKQIYNISKNILKK